MERPKRDVGLRFGVEWFWIFLVGGFCRHLWRVKRDVGFVIRGLGWKMDPGPGPFMAHIVRAYVVTVYRLHSD